MFSPVRCANPGVIRLTGRGALSILALFLLVGSMTSAAFADPAQTSRQGQTRYQNVDWMSSDMASSLDIGMNVMAPAWIPEPFGGAAPSVIAVGGYYQLYWMVPGGSPTFLYIEGTAGGALPGGSPADLNEQLTINASVQGWDAIHDIGIPAGGETPIYDQVWWIANGVLYTVSSNNMTGSDSLSVANSLVVLQAPAPAQPDPPTEAPYVPPVAAEPDQSVDEVPVTSDVEQPVYEEPVVAEPAAPVVSTEQRTVDTGTISEPRPRVVEPEETGEAGSGNNQGSSGQSGSRGSGPWSPERFDPNLPSDGTSGPMPPVIGGDGTGGLYDTALPNTRFRP